MEDKRLRLPVGIQSFEKLRKRNCVYVDKTKYLVDLIDKGDIYFLARPRRFGKSLTISTFDALFSGKKELFKGLYAEEFLNRLNFEPSPVIRLDMSKVTTSEGIEGIRDSILNMTRQVAKKLDVKLSDTQLCGDLLSELIVATAEKYEREAVILVDEYDKPYTDFVNDPVMAEKVREVLRNYYVSIKSNDEHIRFTFITGISKFAKFGVFSTLNTPLDISMMPEYAEICGYTEEEIVCYFPDYLEETASYMQLSTDDLIQRMRDYYNGFTFDSRAKTRLYNPYSTLSFFAKKEFVNYWIDSGRSKVIAEYLKNKRLTAEQFRALPVSRDFVESPGDMDATLPQGFLYQGGYLTLRPGTDSQLTLDYPNTEVRNAMSKMFTQNVVNEDVYENFQHAVIVALREQNIEKLAGIFNRLLARIPYDDYVSAIKQIFIFDEIKMPVQEWLYRSSILSLLLGCGVDVMPEVHSNMGRADLVIRYGGFAWVIEFKVAYKADSSEKKAEEAIRQIEEKNYAKLYPDAVCVGMVIDDEVRQITKIEWGTDLELAKNWRLLC